MSRRLRLWLCSLLGLSILATCVITVGLVNRASGRRKLQQTDFILCNSNSPSFAFPYNIPLSSEAGTVNGTLFDRVPNVIQVDLSVTKVNPEQSTFGVHLEFTPAGDLSDEGDRGLVGLGDFEDLIGADEVVGARRLGRDVNITIGTTTLRFSRLASMQPADLELSMSGDINNYPFDSFSKVFTLTATQRIVTDSPTGPNGAIVSTETFAPASLLVSANAPLLSYSISFPTVCDLSPSADATLILASSSIKRATTTKLFVVVLTIFMWVLSLLAFILAVNVWWTNRQVEPPTIAVTVSMMFALPSIRNSQPHAPPIGSTLDVVGFFWNMVLVALAAALLLANYIYHHTRKARTNQVVDIHRWPHGKAGDILT
ncbi:hypothetical protein HDU85_001170 [Gaertneriomyces sp. JEL0708]|nr:hypothetical protein HDU85_001170 [Gaertneriomyces sp. JEL0708]